MNLPIHKIFQTRWTKLGAIFVVPFFALSLVACEPETLESEEADVPVPTDQADVPETAEVGEGSTAAEELVGETVTVSTEITEVLSPNLFTVFDIESLRGEELLAITSLPIPEQGSNVEVTGMIMELDEVDIREAYNVTLEPDVAEAYAGRPYLAVQAIEMVD